MSTFADLKLSEPLLEALRDVGYETPSPIQVFTNDLNWVNFSSFPQVPVRTWQFAQGAFGNALFAVADDVAPHLNTYSVLSEAAAAGQCWTCLVNPAPVDMR